MWRLHNLYKQTQPHVEPIDESFLLMKAKRMIYIFYRWSIFPCFLLSMVILVNYFSDYNQRAGEHKWIVEDSDADGGLYFAKYAYLGKDWVFLKIFKKGGSRVLAERLYSHGDGKQIYWLKDKVLYDSLGNDFPHHGEVDLPPTWVDRALTYLP